MISYEDALKIAREKSFESVDECEECEDCYIFSEKKDFIDLDGGPIVIMKDDGKAYSYTTYIAHHDYKEPKPLRKFDV